MPNRYLKYQSSSRYPKYLNSSKYLKYQSFLIEKLPNWIPKPNLKDVFNRALRSSDPKFSSIFLEQRLKTKIVLELPPVVKNLMFQSTDTSEPCKSSKSMVPGEGEEEPIEVIDLENEIMSDLAELSEDFNIDENVD